MSGDRPGQNHLIYISYNPTPSPAVFQMSPAPNFNPEVLRLHQQTTTQMMQQNWQEAIANCERALALEPDFSPAHKTLGTIRQLQGRWTEAESHYQTALNLQPDFAEVYANLGSLYAQQQRWEPSIRAYEKAIQLRPDAAGFYRNLAKVWTRCGRTEKAAECGYEAILLEPQRFTVQDYLNLGKQLQEQEKLESAIALYQKGITVHPNSAILQYQLGQVFSENEQVDDALAAHRRAVEIDPDVFYFYNALGNALNKQGKWGEAIAAYRQAINRNPNVDVQHMNLADALMQVEQIDEAIAAYQKAIQLKPQPSWFYQKLGHAFKVSGQIDEAIAAYKKAIELQPDQMWIYKLILPLLLQKKDWREAQALSLQALQAKPDFLPGYFFMAKIFEGQGKIREAQKCKNFKILDSDFIEKIYPNFSRNLADAKSHPQIAYFELYSPAKIRLSPAHIVSKNLPEIFLENQVQTFGSGVAIVPHARLWGDVATGAVLTQDNQLITDLSSGSAELVAVSDRLPPPREIDGTIAFLSVRWGGGFFHWMLDTFARFHLLQKAGIDFDSINKFVVNDFDKPYQQETVAALGIPADKIIANTEVNHIQAERAIVPTPNLLYRRGLQMPNWAFDFLKQTFCPQIFNPNIPSQNHRIYIDRTHAPGRHVLNNQAVMQLLEPLNFQPVVLERMTIREQAELFANAEAIISPHGAGLTNLAFCRPGTQVIEVLSPDYCPSCFRTLSSLCHLEYYPLLGEPCPQNQPNAVTDKNIDIRFDLDTLKQAIEWAMLAI